MILLVSALYSFLGNCALLGPSVYIGLYAEQFKITPTKASDLVSYPNLAFGFGMFFKTNALHLTDLMRNRLLDSCTPVSEDRSTSGYASIHGVCT